ALNPRKIFGLPIPRIEEGLPAELTVFSPVQKWAYRRDRVRSRSFNSPFLDKEFVGKPVAVINNDQMEIF
ncbi:MAG: hypothetical protein KDD09_26905, partial [Phaeodactylibacter sp.]|nr:hypothetical protein [Phaeodactylibacter sp.]